MKFCAIMAIFILLFGGMWIGSLDDEEDFKRQIFASIFVVFLLLLDLTVFLILLFNQDLLPK